MSQDQRQPSAEEIIQSMQNQLDTSAANSKRVADTVFQTLIKQIQRASQQIADDKKRIAFLEDICTRHKINHTKPEGNRKQRRAAEKKEGTKKVKIVKKPTKKPKPKK